MFPQDKVRNALQQKTRTFLLDKVHNMQTVHLNTKGKFRMNMERRNKMNFGLPPRSNLICKLEQKNSKYLKRLSSPKHAVEDSPLNWAKELLPELCSIQILHKLLRSHLLVGKFGMLETVEKCWVDHSKQFET
jgi:hypothetical protein